MQCLYEQDGEFHFMNNATYEQVAIRRDLIGDAASFLHENLDVTVLFHNGQAISVDLPNFVELAGASQLLVLMGDEVGILGHEEHRERHPRVLDVEAGDDLRLALGDVER